MPMDYAEYQAEVAADIADVLAAASCEESNAASRELSRGFGECQTMS